jgi:hypothetical protein
MAVTWQTKTTPSVCDRKKVRMIAAGVADYGKKYVHSSVWETQKTNNKGLSDTKEGSEGDWI